MNWFDYLNYDPSDFGSGDVGGDYNPDVSTVVSPDFSDPEIIKLLRQQDIAKSGGSPLGNMGGKITGSDSSP